MKRKLVKQGAATLMVSLPSKWIKENKLEKGSEINLEEVENGLMIMPEVSEKKSEVTIALSNSAESTINSLIDTSYRLGYDRINVSFTTENQFKTVNKIIKDRLIGMEITKKDKNSCIIENVTEPSLDQYDNILRKMFLDIDALFEITKAKLENSQNQEIENFEEIEDRINKYNSFCRRVITKSTLSKKKFGLTWTILVLIHHAQRDIYNIHKYKYLESKIKGSEKTLNLLKMTREMNKLVQKAIYEKNISLVEEIHKLGKEIYKEGSGLLEKSKGKEIMIILHLISASRQFYFTNAPLFGLII